jgi:hypothetical protein
MPSGEAEFFVPGRLLLLTDELGVSPAPLPKSLLFPYEKVGRF